MDWLRQIPMGQYVDGRSGWLRRLDPRLKLLWSFVFLLSPVLAGPIWRVALVLTLLLINLCSGLPLRLWWRSMVVLAVLESLSLDMLVTSSNLQLILHYNQLIQLHYQLPRQQTLSC